MAEDPVKKQVDDEKSVQDEVVDTSQPVHPRDGISDLAWKAIVVGNAINAAINGYDVSNVANVQVSIYEAFGHIELLPWLSLTYSLVNVAVVPLCRRLTGFCELKALSMVSWLVVLAGSALSGAAPNIQSVIVGRAIMAIGCAALYQVGLTYNVTFARPHELPLAQAILGVSFAIGLICGPIVSGAFAENQHATWRWAFYIVLPIAVIPIVALVFLFPTYKVPSNKSALAHLKDIDWVGQVLHIGFFVLLGLACIFSGPTWPFDSGASIACWVLLGVVLVAYVLQQALGFFTTPQHSTIPVHLLKKRIVATIVISTACISAGYAVTLYYTPIYYAFTRGHGALASAVRLLPYICVFIFMTFLAAGLFPAVRYYQPFYLSSGVLLLIGAGLQQTIKSDTSEARVMGLEALIGGALGLGWQLALPVLNPSLQPHERLDAVAIFNTFQLGGIAIALAIAGSVYQNVGYDLVSSAVSSRAPELGFSAQDVRELLAGVGSHMLARAPPDLRGSVVAAVTVTILRVFYIVLAAGAVLFVAAACMKFEAVHVQRPAKPSRSEETTGKDQSV